MKLFFLGQKTFRPDHSLDGADVVAAETDFSVTRLRMCVIRAWFAIKSLFEVLTNLKSVGRLEAYCVEVLVREVVEVVHRVYFARRDGSDLFSKVRLQKLANLINEQRYIVWEEPVEVLLSPLVPSHNPGSDLFIPIERSLFLLNIISVKTLTADRSCLDGHLLPYQVLRKEALTVCLNINTVVLHSYGRFMMYSIVIF